MKVAYIEKNFRDSTLDIIYAADGILREYAAMGYNLTVRQLYYQFVARDLFPASWIDEKYNLRQGLPVDTKNTMKNYKRLASIIDDGRLAGFLDWQAIVDRTRRMRQNAHWDSIGDILETCAENFRYNLWEDQPKHVEVWIEKDALIGIIEGPCISLDVPYYATRGYNSQSEMWRACRRFKEKMDEGKNVIVIHLSDHDPSGLNMTEDLENRIDMFMARADVERLALTMEQVREKNPPPNPAKITDPRAKVYIQQFGYESWELDALEPTELSNLVENAISEHIDWELFYAAEQRQEEARERLHELAEREQ